MFRSIQPRPWLRGALVGAAFGSVLVGASIPAHAFGEPWWWPFKPKAHPAPEIDVGLVRSAAVILVGGVLVLRRRRRSS